jgi:importin subunit beta-1
MPVLLKLMGDENVIVKDTTAWTIGRICEILPDVPLASRYLQHLLEVIVSNLFSEPRVASNICWALSSLNEAAFDAINADADTPPPETYALSPFYESLVQKLLQVTDRPDGNEVCMTLKKARK